MRYPYQYAATEKADTHAAYRPDPIIIDGILDKKSDGQHQDGDPDLTDEVLPDEFFQVGMAFEKPFFFCLFLQGDKWLLRGRSWKVQGNDRIFFLRRRTGWRGGCRRLNGSGGRGGRRRPGECCRLWGFDRRFGNGLYRRLGRPAHLVSQL